MTQDARVVVLCVPATAKQNVSFVIIPNTSALLMKFSLKVIPL
jgi:hypothetical protein